MPTPESVGRYQIERLIAHGGMGSLYLARDPVIDRMVAIKFLKEGFDDPGARERFAREARAAGRLHHPNIVTIFDVGEHQDRPFIAMEYVAGETLGQLVARRAVRRLWEKLEILEELCAGLHYAHTASIVHRDIKPSNVMRDQSGVVKILDFGIARGAGGVITQAGEVVGTLNYMSPEQLSGEPVDHRTDIYSVGVLAYELITDHMAFPGTIQTGVLFKILNAAPLPIDALVPGIDPDIPAIIDRAIARQPEVRYPDLEALRQDLAVVRARLFETAGDLDLDVDDVADPDAETRFMPPRLSSGVQAPLSSRPGSGRTPSARVMTARPTTLASPPRRSPARILGVTGAVLGTALAAAWTFNLFPFAPAPSDVGTPPQAPSVSTPAAPAVATPRPPEDAARSPQEQLLTTARATARQQIVAGQNEQALETLIAGLAVDPRDPELNRLVDDIAGTARRIVSDARAAAAVRGATVKSSAVFRDAQTRQREAERRLRAGDRIPGIRDAWAAATLYSRAPEAGAQPSTASAPSVPPTRGTDKPAGSPTTGNQAVPISPSLESLNNLPGRVNKPPGAPLPPAAAPKPAPPVQSEPAPDPRAAEITAVREALRRYREAYQSLDSAAVGKLMPSMTAGQLRDLERDFANYRRYTVEISEQRINVEGQTATVTCQVVRSFETRDGEKSGHTVSSTFHLRRTGSSWIIERLESR